MWLAMLQAAFECMYTLLDSCLDRLDIFDFLQHVEDGLKDHYDIKMLTYLMLVRLSNLCPSAVLQSKPHRAWGFPVDPLFSWEIDFLLWGGGGFSELTFNIWKKKKSLGNVLITFRTANETFSFWAWRCQRPQTRSSHSRPVLLFRCSVCGSNCP